MRVHMSLGSALKAKLPYIITVVRPDGAQRYVPIATAGFAALMVVKIRLAQPEATVDCISITHTRK